MGKMNRSTYQLNAYTSDWGGGHVGVCVYVRDEGHVLVFMFFGRGGGVEWAS